MRYRVLPLFMAPLLLWPGGAVSAQDTSAVRAIPNTVTFSDYTDSATIRLFASDQAIPGEAIRSVKALASDHDYIRFFLVSIDRGPSGGVTIRPHPELAEVGSYDLVIETAKGRAVVDIKMPLDALIDIVQRRARERGISLEEARRELGLAREGLRETFSVTLPPVITEGQALSIRLDRHDESRTYTWRVNGNVVHEAQGAGDFQYVFPSADEYELAYTETKDGARLVSWQGAILVVPEKEIPIEAKAHQTVALRGPEGYSAYTWRVGNQHAGSGEVFQRRFDQPAVYHIECLATGKKDGHPDEFRRVTWAAQVR